MRPSWWEMNVEYGDDDNEAVPEKWWVAVLRFPFVLILFIIFSIYFFLYPILGAAWILLTNIYSSLKEWINGEKAN